MWCSRPGCTVFTITNTTVGAGFSLRDEPIGPPATVLNGDLEPDARATTCGRDVIPQEAYI